MAPDLLSLLANKSNQAILGLLAVEPAWPRKIGQLVSLSETETSRRLKRMEDLGLVQGEWTPVEGKNVKLYRLSVRGATVHFNAAGMELRLEPFDGTAQPAVMLRSFTHHPPKVEGFVGREEVLELLDGHHGVAILEALPGMGKTSVAARWAEGQERPVFWHTFRGVESVRWLANHLAVFHARHGDRHWLDALGQDLEETDLQESVVEMLERKGAAHILDDVHRIEDSGLKGALSAAMARVQNGILVLTARAPVRHDPTLDQVHVVQLEGLDDADVAAMLEAKGLRVEEHLLPRIREEVGGHPLALNLLLEAAERMGVRVVDLLDRIPEREVEEYLLNEVYQTLTETERQVLTQASIFRHRFTLDHLRALAQKDPEHALARLRRRHLVVTHDDGHSLHEIIRNFFYQRLQGRKRLHEKVARLCLAADTLEGRLEAMYHYLEAGRRDKTLDLLEEDLDLRAFDFLDAGYHRIYAEVLDAFQESDMRDPYRWAVIQDDRGDIAYHRNDDRGALAHYDLAEEIFRAHDDHDRLADLAWKRGLVLERLGRQEEAREVVTGGLKLASEAPLVQRRLRELAERIGAAVPEAARDPQNG